PAGPDRPLQPVRRRHHGRARRISRNRRHQTLTPAGGDGFRLCAHSPPPHSHFRSGVFVMIDHIDGAIDYDVQPASRDDAPTVVLVPGSCSTGAAWRAVVAAWQGRYRCVTTSLLGYGGTVERRTPQHAGL